jgi:hypothetical protein
MASSNSSPSLELGTDTECPLVAVAPTVAVRGKKMFKLVAAAGDRSDSSLSLSKREAADNINNDSQKCNKNSSSHIDLLSPLPEDVLCRITSFLDARSLLQMRLINHFFQILAARNAAGWDNLTDNLWKDKVHVCAEARHMRNTTATPADSATTQQPDQENSNSNNSINNSSLSAYKLSLQDSLNRHHVSREELCYDPDTMTGTVWSFRFKESAGSDWTVQDPWYNGLPCRKMVFLPDGSVKQYIPGTTTGTGNNAASANDAWMAQDDILLQHQHLLHPHLPPHYPQAQQPRQPQHAHQPQQLQQLFNDRPGGLAAAPGLGHLHQRTAAAAASAASAAASASLALGLPTLVDPHMTMTWRFLTRPMDLPTRETGSYVRFSVGGRDVPTYSVRRSPVGNWGFVMESCWGIYASFELPPKAATTTEDTATANTAGANVSARNSNNYNHRGAVPQERTRRRLRRTEDGSVWVDEPEDEEDDDATQHPRNNNDSGSPDTAGIGARERSRMEGEASLRDDASLLITNEIQWREAFLYNVGARVLPEGDEAADEFDRAWGGL